jgi:hypothetical protein
MMSKLPEIQWVLNKVPHEILWLAGILCVSVPLTFVLWHLRGLSPLLAKAWQQVIPVPLHRKVLLYLLVAIGCYVGRLVAKALVKLGPTS